MSGMKVKFLFEKQNVEFIEKHFFCVLTAINRYLIAFLSLRVCVFLTRKSEIAEKQHSLPTQPAL